MTVPAPDAPFSEKMAYYRTQHRSRGVRITHMQLTGLIHLSEQHGQLLARRSRRKAARKGAAKVLS
jgi:hypothetical protein